MKILDGSLIFDDYTPKWTKNTPKFPKQRVT